MNTTIKGSTEPRLWTRREGVATRGGAFQAFTFDVFHATQAYLAKAGKDDVLYGAMGGRKTHVFDNGKWRMLVN